MKAWLGDFFRAAWALLYWNVRKSVFVLRARRGSCPCHNRSDSGEAMRTGCRVIPLWNNPARFRRICPLLTQNSAGRWVCSVPAAEVRPFWGRAVAIFATGAAIVALAVGLTVFGVMHGVGFEVRLKQVFWPAHWHELKEARVKYFVQQARAYYAKGEIKPVLNALSSAQLIDPNNYEVGMMLAQFYQIGNPVFADTTYAQMIEAHPARRNETAQVWFRSLLARNRLALVANLATQQIDADSASVWVWTNALIFSAQQLRRPELLQRAIDKTKSREVSHVLKLAMAVEQAPDDAARRELLRASTALDSTYAQVYRIERLIDFGWGNDALALLAVSSKQLSGRDVARLSLAAYEVERGHRLVVQEFETMLAPQRPVKIAEINLLALHLVQYPDPMLLENVMNGTSRLPKEDIRGLVETYFVLLASAGTAQNADDFDLIATKIQSVMGIKSPAINSMRAFFFGQKQNAPSLDQFLLEINPLSLELNYKLLAKYPARNK